MISIEVLYPDNNTLDYYATVYSQLRKKGKPIPTNDIWIAAIAIQYDLTLLTLDDHFGFVEGLSIIR
jgi:predicted nucleic acid-binding protein